MSAICGIFNLDGKPVLREEIAAMMKPMAYWGPDDSGIWVDGPVGLGHLMLHTTPESLHEKLPLVSADGNLVLVADARIDNREEMIEVLRTQHPVQRTAPDSELLVRAYEMWGADCASHLVGDFAIVIWDRREQLLYSAIDICGTRVIYYSCKYPSLRFGTAQRFAFGAHVPPLDEQRVVDYLLIRRTSPSSSFYSGVHRIPPGHWATWTPIRQTVHEYWSPDHIMPIRYAKEDSYFEAFRDVFDLAVRSHLRSSGKIGIELSGGLDSCSVAAVAARQLAMRGARLSAFSYVPHPAFDKSTAPGRLANESSLILQLVEQYSNLDPTFIAAEDRSPLFDIDSDFEACGRPLDAVRNRFWIRAIIEEARRRGIRVLLNGQFGNSTLSWSAAGYLAGLVCKGKLLEFAREIGRRSARRACREIAAEALAPLLPDFAWAFWRRFRDGRDPRYPSFVKRSFAHAWNSGTPRRIRADPRANRLHVLNVARTNVGETEHCLYGAMQCEARDPTRDRRVIEFCFGIPDDCFVQDGSDRMLVRRAMSGALPRSILWNRNRGLQAADAALRLADYRSLMVSYCSRIENASRFLNIPAMRMAIDESSSWPPRLIAVDDFLRANMLAEFCDWLVRCEINYLA